jgi:hypothetical protein
MRWRDIARVVCCAALALFIARPVLAQTTGQIEGTVLDSQDKAIPGATVTVTSPQLQGTRTTLTDGSGQFRFPTLPPGTYAVKSQLTGFQPAQEDNVRVALTQTATVSLRMAVGAVSAQVNVTASAPTIDTSTSSSGVTADETMFNQLAVRRDFYAISRLAPGVNEDAVGPAAHGSTGAENIYLVEGLNMTGIVAGQQMKTINFDFIQEVSVKTQGMNAEYGRMTGTVMEAVTKSGGNVFHGGIFGFGTGSGLTAKNDTGSKTPSTTTQVVDVTSQWDSGFDVGGYAVKDKLWFFGAYDGIKETDSSTVIRAITSPNSPGVGSVVPLDITRQTFAGKLTYNLAKNQTIVGSVNGDPAKRDGNIFAIAGPPTTWQGTIDTGSVDGVVRYDGVFHTTWIAQAQYGRHNENQTYGGLGTTIPLSIDSRVSPNPLSGGFGFYQNLDLHRDELRADVTKYQGRHTFKGGVDYEHVVSDINSFNGGGGQRIYNFMTSAGVNYFRHRYYVNDRAPGYVRSDPTTWQIAVPLTSVPVDKNTALYAQDNWKALPNLTLEGGVRWERQDLFGRDPTPPVIELKSNWAGRVGFVWDPMKDGRSKVFAHYGRFYESIPMDINIRSFGGEVQCFCYNFSPSASVTAPDPTAPKRSSLLGGPEAVDPNLKGQYIDEYLFGVEREIAPALVVAARYNYRTLGRVIEDFLVPSEGTYFIANPAEGTLGQTLSFYDYSTVASPKASRTNKEFELSARKRFTNHWQLMASYVWSKLEGNYDGTFQNSTGQLDPNINSAFDYADFLINATGPLTNNRTTQLKLDGSYQFSKGKVDGLSIGLSTRYLSGTPLTAYGYSFAYANWEYYLTPRGSLGTNPGTYEADVHVGYPVHLGGNKSLNLIMDVFNLFNRQAITTLDQRYNLASDPVCSGIPVADCNQGSVPNSYDGGLRHQPNSLLPVAQLADPRATATNPDFLKAGRGFTSPFSARFGVRFTF